MTPSAEEIEAVVTSNLLRKPIKPRTFNEKLTTTE